MPSIPSIPGAQLCVGDGPAVTAALDVVAGLDPVPGSEALALTVNPKLPAIGCPSFEVTRQLTVYFPAGRAALSGNRTVVPRT